MRDSRTEKLKSKAKPVPAQILFTEAFYKACKEKKKDS